MFPEDAGEMRLCLERCPCEMVGAIVKDLAPNAGAQAILLVNGFGGTPTMELHLMVHSALRTLRRKGVRVSRYLTRNFVTSL